MCFLPLRLLVFNVPVRDVRVITTHTHLLYWLFSSSFCGKIRISATYRLQWVGEACRRGFDGRFLVADGVEHLSTCLLAMGVTAWETRLFKPRVRSLTGLLRCFLLSSRGSVDNSRFAYRIGQILCPFDDGPSSYSLERVPDVPQVFISTKPR